TRISKTGATRWTTTTGAIAAPAALRLAVTAVRAANARPTATANTCAPVPNSPDARSRAGTSVSGPAVAATEATRRGEPVMGLFGKKHEAPEGFVLRGGCSVHDMHGPKRTTFEDANNDALDHGRRMHESPRYYGGYIEAVQVDEHATAAPARDAVDTDE